MPHKERIYIEMKKIKGVIRMIKKNKKNEKGFTMIELIIVIAIMGILMAILAPSFLGMTTSAKVKSDIRSIQTVQNQINYHYSVNSEYPGLTAEPANNSDYLKMLGALVNAGLLDAKSVIGTVATDNSGATGLNLQSQGASLVWKNKQLYLYSADADVKKVIGQLKGHDAQWGAADATGGVDLGKAK